MKKDLKFYRRLNGVCAVFLRRAEAALQNADGFRLAACGWGNTAWYEMVQDEGFSGGLVTPISRHLAQKSEPKLFELLENHYRPRCLVCKAECWADGVYNVATWRIQVTQLGISNLLRYQMLAKTLGEKAGEFVAINIPGCQFEFVLTNEDPLERSLARRVGNFHYFPVWAKLPKLQEEDHVRTDGAGMMFDAQGGIFFATNIKHSTIEVELEFPKSIIDGFVKKFGSPVINCPWATPRQMKFCRE